MRHVQLVILTLIAVGCSYEPAPIPPPKVRQTEARGKPPAPEQGDIKTEKAAPRRTAPAGGPSVVLSAGVALPQSLPTGTAMGFSVDYRFSGGPPSPPAQYVWVIVPSRGEPVAQPVRLQAKGTLEGFVQQLKSGDGPFDTYLATPDGKPVSAKLRLK